MTEGTDVLTGGFWGVMVGHWRSW